MKEGTALNITIVLLALAIVTSTMITIVFLPRMRMLYEENKYYLKAEENTDQELVKNLAGVCNLYNSSITKMKCVHLLISTSDLYNYTLNKDFVLADDLIDEGADCESWTILYMATYKSMNLSVQPILLPTHVYLTVYDEGSYCNVDQLGIDCHKLTVEQ